MKKKEFGIKKVRNSLKKEHLERYIRKTINLRKENQEEELKIFNIHTK